MRKVKMWRYYCDFCKKSGSSGGHMKAHENGCTKNPDRECGMCRVTETEQQPMDDLLKAFGIGDAEGMKNLTDMAENCPACILATIRQSGVMDENQTLDEEGYPTHMAWMDFSYRDEKASFWSSQDMTFVML